MELDEREAHCVARLLQSAMFGKGNAMAGCAFCKYQCDEKNTLYRKIQEKFETETGVDLSETSSLDVLYCDFPYKKFLKNSNETVKEHFRNIFSDI